MQAIKELREHPIRRAEPKRRAERRVGARARRRHAGQRIAACKWSVRAPRATKALGRESSLARVALVVGGARGEHSLELRHQPPLGSQLGIQGLHDPRLLELMLGLAHLTELTQLILQPSDQQLLTAAEPIAAAAAAQ